MPYAARVTHATLPRPLAAIDVGTNAVRLEIARPRPDGTLELLHQQRDPVRPGEGVFATGLMGPAVVERLLATLRRYAALCKRFHAQPRAVATSALREARNRAAVVAQVQDETGLELEVISGPEEARLICLGVLHGQPDGEASTLVDIGGGSTEVVHAVGARPQQLWSAPIGSVRLTELFEAGGKVTNKTLTLMRAYARESLEETLPQRPTGLPRTALGSSGTIQALVKFAAGDGVDTATADQLERAVEKLAPLNAVQRRRYFDGQRAEVIMGGAVVLEQTLRHLKLQSMRAVDRGLREGVLRDLVLRQGPLPQDGSLTEAARAFGRRLQYDDKHAGQVARVALELFDQLADVHELPPTARPLLELAALLHDIGYAVSHRSHHKHGAYLIANADLPGLTDHERMLCALIARFHRRSAPERAHPELAALSVADLKWVRRLSTLLRIADTCDRSHHQPVESVQVRLRGGAVRMKLQARQPLDLELWDLQHETALFRRVFGHPLEVAVERAAVETGGLKVSGTESVGD